MPATSAAFDGRVALASVEVIPAVSVTELTTFQFASTALTVTVKAPPAVCALGAPDLPPLLESSSLYLRPGYDGLIRGQLSSVMAHGLMYGGAVDATVCDAWPGEPILSAIRDYVHVWDLARAHVRAVEKFDEVLAAAGEPSVVINVGTGAGVTVRELVVMFEEVFGHSVPVREAEGRPGDVPGAFANVDRSHELLGWQSELTIREAIASALAWTEKRQEILGYE